MTNPITCQLDFNLSDRRRSVTALIKRASPFADPTASDPLVLDLKNCQYLGPDGAAILAAMILDLRHNKVGWVN